jgi:hypothetical protein
MSSSWNSNWTPISGYNYSDFSGSMPGGTPWSAPTKKTSSGGGGNKMWGAALGLASAGIGAWGQMRSANMAARAQLNAAKAADWRNTQNILARRDTAKFGEGSKLQNQMWEQIASDKDLRRDQAAEMFDLTRLDPMRAAATRDFQRGAIGLESSAEARNLRQQKNKEQLQYQTALRAADMNRMFGYVPDNFGGLA